MATGKDYIEYVLEMFDFDHEVSARPMMGEYILYYKGVNIGSVCDNRVLLKTSNATLCENARFEKPYESAKRELLLVEDVDDRKENERLLKAVYAEVTATGKRK